MAKIVRYAKFIIPLIIVLGCAFLALRGGDDKGELFLYCGAGIRPAMDGLRQEFTATTGIPVQITYAGSGCLLSMLTFAKSGDLYMPGERYYVEQAKKDGFLTDDVDVAYFVPVVIVKKGNPKGIRSLADLARDDIRVGIGNPDSVACGLVAKKLLEKQDLWEKIKANIDARGAYSGTAMELTNAIVLNALDAAINWDAMAFPVRDKVDILTIPKEKNMNVPIPLGRLTWSRHVAAADAFIAFVRSDKGKAHFERHGYHTSTEPYALSYYGNTILE